MYKIVCLSGVLFIYMFKDFKKHEQKCQLCRTAEEMHRTKDQKIFASIVTANAGLQNQERVLIKTETTNEGKCCGTMVLYTITCII